MSTSKLTKIVATVSDRRCEPEFIAALYGAGVNVVRMNSAHLAPEGFERIVRNVRAVSPKIALMIDTKGPEVRTTVTATGAPISFVNGQKVTFAGAPKATTTAERIALSYADIARAVRPGMHLLIDDGALDFVVDAVNPDGRILATCTNDGDLGSRKSVNIPGAAIDLPALSERDRAFIRQAAELQVDFVAHSFVRSVDDVEVVRRAIAEAGGTQKVIAKIENQQGVDNLSSILDRAYGIMVARGDLGIEVPAERIPTLQRHMIRECINRHRPVIVATQMLHSMITAPRPTRAEVSDVALAVSELADAVMLSGETANGRYPVEAVTTMASIARETERSLSGADIPPVPELHDAEVTSFLARQAVVASRKLGVKAILTDTYTGRTARYVSSFRGSIPIYAICYRPATMRLLALSRGVETVPVDCDPAAGECLRSSLDALVAAGAIASGARVAYLGGRRGQPGPVTYLEIDAINSITRM